MMTLQELSKKYGTDKHNRTMNGMVLGHCYIDKFYTNVFSPLVEEPVKLLEIGVYHGASVKMWEEYFINGQITGIDIDPKFPANSMPCVITADAYSTSGLKHFNDSSFDIIIDDGSHILDDQLYVVRNYMRKLKPGGMLIIEDIQKIEHIGILMAAAGKRRNAVYDLRYANGRYDDVIIVMYA